MRERLGRFNAEGLDGLGDRPGAGRKPRLTETERSAHHRPGAQHAPRQAGAPGGRPLVAPDLDGDARTGPWTRWPRPAQACGIAVERSQVRRILLAEGVRWRQTRSWTTSADPEFAPKGRGSSRSTPRPPAGATVLDLDELGPVSPRTFPPAAGLVARRPPHQGAAGVQPRPGEGVGLRRPARARRAGGDPDARLRAQHRRATCGCSTPSTRANPTGDLYLIADNLSSHKSPPIQAWLAAHPRVQQVFIPKGACWLNLQEAWWRLFRKEALAGQSFADAGEIDLRHRRGHPAPQPPGEAVDLGPVPAPTPPLPAPVGVPPLRKRALAAR